MKLSHSQPEASVLWSLIILGVVLLLSRDDLVMAEIEHQTGDVPIVAKLTLLGLSPTMSWSPDSRRVAIASECYDDYLERAEMGVHVLDIRTKKAHLLGAGPGYRPSWLDEKSVVWGRVDEYQPGLQLAILREGDEPTVTRLVKTPARLVFATPDGNVLYATDETDSGFEEWFRYLVATKTVEKVEKNSPVQYVEHWYLRTYPEIADNQCVSRLRSIRVTADDEGHFIELGAEKKIRLDGGPPARWNGEPITGCFSPNRKYVSFLTEARPEELAEEDDYGFTLHIAELPMDLTDTIPPHLFGDELFSGISGCRLISEDATQVGCFMEEMDLGWLGHHLEIFPMSSFHAAQNFILYDDTNGGPFDSQQVDAPGVTEANAYLKDRKFRWGGKHEDCAIEKGRVVFTHQGNQVAIALPEMPGDLAKCCRWKAEQGMVLFEAESRAAVPLLEDCDGVKKGCTEYDHEEYIPATYVFFFDASQAR